MRLINLSLLLCASDCLGRRLGPRFLGRGDDSRQRQVRDLYKILHQVNTKEIPHGLKVPDSFSHLVSDMKNNQSRVNMPALPSLDLECKYSDVQEVALWFGYCSEKCRGVELEMIFNHLEEGQEWCKYAYDKFKANQEKAKLHMVRRMSKQHCLYTVETQSSLLITGGGAHTHRVSLMDSTCTCGKWEANKIPCSHLIAICAKYKHDAMEFMDRFYRVSEWYQSYKLIFQPLKDRLEWPEPAERRKAMSNSRLIREKGHPKSMRIRNEMDDEDRELPTSLWIENGPKLKCGLCRQGGHNRRRCLTRTVDSTSCGAI
nr:putative galacturonosyltransferase 13 [Quercus suber]